MKIKILVIICMTFVLGGGIYMLSSSQKTESAFSVGVPLESGGLKLAPAPRRPLAPEKEIKEPRISDGPTIIKESLPPKLEKLNARLRKLASEIERDTKKLGKQSEADFADSENMKDIIKNADQLIKQTNKKHGINTALVKAEYHKMLKQPITSPKAKAIMAKLKGADKKLLELERRFKNLNDIDKDEAQ